MIETLNSVKSEIIRPLHSWVVPLYHLFTYLLEIALCN
jgi:hypothetical protein